jgi:bacillolysin
MSPILNSCVASLPIIVGTPKISINYSMNGGCNGTFQTWSLAASAPGTVSSWLWTVDNPNSGNWYIYHPTFASTFVDVSGGGGISVTATNACGSSKQGVTIYSNCGHSNAIIASPNPTSSDLTVSLTQPLSTSTASTNSKTQTPKMIYQVLVADQAGNVRKQFNYSAGVNSTKINLTGLLSGTYTIVVFDGINWNGVQVIKE